MSVAREVVRAKRCNAKDSKVNLPASAGSNKCVIMQAKRAHIASLRARNACSNATARGRLRCRHRQFLAMLRHLVAKQLAAAADAIKASSGCQQWMATLCCRATTSASNCASRERLRCDRVTSEQSVERQGFKSELTCSTVSNECKPARNSAGHGRFHYDCEPASNAPRRLAEDRTC